MSESTVSQSTPGESAEWPLGVQSFSYREHTVGEMCAELAETPIEAVELCGEHVLPDMTTEAIEERLATIDAAGLSVCGYGVVDFDGNPEDAESAVDLVDQLGGEYLSVAFPPGDRDVVEALLAAADDNDMDLSIHNHGPESDYATVEDVVTVLDDVDDPWLGACVDTGHFLRVDEAPAEVIPAVGDRVYALHLKDYHDTETEAIPGEGQLDLVDLLALLDEHTTLDRPLVIEYEAAPDDPTPGVRKAAENVREAAGTR